MICKIFVKIFKIVKKKRNVVYQLKAVTWLCLSFKLKRQTYLKWHQIGNLWRQFFEYLVTFEFRQLFPNFDLSRQFLLDDVKKKDKCKRQLITFLETGFSMYDFKGRAQRVISFPCPVLTLAKLARSKRWKFLLLRLEDFR